MAATLYPRRLGALAPAGLGARLNAPRGLCWEEPGVTSSTPQGGSPRLSATSTPGGEGFSPVWRPSRRTRTLQTALAQGTPGHRSVNQNTPGAGCFSLVGFPAETAWRGRPARVSLRTHTPCAHQLRQPVPGRTQVLTRPAHTAHSTAREQTRTQALGLGGVRGGPWGGARWAGHAGSGRVHAAAVFAAPPSVLPLAGFLALQPLPYRR